MLDSVCLFDAPCYCLAQGAGLHPYHRSRHRGGFVLALFLAPDRPVIGRDPILARLGFLHWVSSSTAAAGGPSFTSLSPVGRDFHLVSSMT